MTANSMKASRRGKSSGSKATTKVAIVGAIAIAVFGGSWLIWANSGPAGGLAFQFQVGKPGPGDMAPPIRLSTARGTNFDLASLHGKTVLVYFQEGIMCQPCWDQLRDIESNFGKFRALGIDTLVSVTTDPADLLKVKVGEEHLLMPVLSDPALAVSKAYDANSYGMMGQSRDGHSFIVIGPDGRIRWRADYGGAPKYTMYVAVPNLLADIGRGLAEAP